MSAEGICERVAKRATKLAYSRHLNPGLIRSSTPEELFDMALEVPWDSAHRRGRSKSAVVVMAVHQVLGEVQLEKFITRIERKLETENKTSGNGLKGELHPGVAIDPNL